MKTKKTAKKIFQKETAFTIIEMTVAVAIFILIFTMTTSIFSNALKSQRKVYLFQEVQDNGRTIIETVARELRMSKIATDCGIFDELQLIRNDTEEEVFYRFEETDSKFTRQSGTEDALDLNSGKIKINNFKFYVSCLSEDFDETGYHRVTLFMNLSAEKDPAVNINLQTTITSRPPPCSTGTCLPLI